MIPRYVFDGGALIAAERGKDRATRYLRLVQAGRARILIPLPVIAEWWRGRTDVRDVILSAGEIAVAALADATVITADVHDFDRLSTHFPGVVVLSA
ncbi:MAG: hypothetical protein JNK04_12535 [Myxococcales bacterium]|nr:hypothetical protein [Myxococcales bacterium]